MTEKGTRVHTRLPGEQSSMWPFDPQRLIALTPIRPHETIADIGCGEGDLAIPLAKYVFDGKVYAVDTDEEKLATVTARAERARIGNVETRLFSRNKLPLDDESVDGLVIASALHESSRPKTLVKELARVLREHAWAAVIEWIGDSGQYDDVTKSKRLTGEQVQKIAQEAGLHRVSLRDIDDRRYLLVVRK